MNAAGPTVHSMTDGPKRCTMASSPHRHSESVIGLVNGLRQMSVNQGRAARDHDHRPGTDGRLLDHAAASADGECEQLAPPLVAQLRGGQLLRRDRGSAGVRGILSGGAWKPVLKSLETWGFAYGWPLSSTLG